MLAVENLTVGFRSPAGPPTIVVSDCGFTLHPSRILGIAGESGCGKSTAVLSAIGFPIPSSIRLSGSSTLGNTDLLCLSVAQLRVVWGRQVAYVAQDAAQSLNPLMRIGQLLAEPLGQHLGLGKTELRARARQLLADVRIPDPEHALRRYPHEFSGGQQQRIALAIAMACSPRVLVLDEPTTGLDVTTQAQIAELIRTLVRGGGTAAVMISHDLGLLATVCDDLAIMYGGEIVETGDAAQLYAAPAHPYAAALIDAAPRISDTDVPVGIPGLPPAQAVTAACGFSDRCRFANEQCRANHPELSDVFPGRSVRCFRARELHPLASARSAAGRRAREKHVQPLLRIDSLRCSYGRQSAEAAVDGVSLTVAPGETLALVGESGSGKSTLLKAVAGLHSPDAGTISFSGADLAKRAIHRDREHRRAIQLVFQNPHSSLNPRHTVATILERPLHLFRPELNRQGRDAEILRLLADVRLDPDLRRRHPHELSGGQKQRVALARAFAATPDLILCDEVVSALDVSVQATVLALLATLADEHHTALLFVTHDLAVVRSIADRVAVMRDGRLVEIDDADAIFSRPTSDYTRVLLDAVPDPPTSR